MSFEYLASPYTHEDSAVRQKRYEYARHATAQLLLERRWIYSPIVHCHDLALTHELPYEFEFWWAYNRAMLSAAKGLIILRIDGYDTSKGIAQEKAYAEANHIPWSYL